MTPGTTRGHQARETTPAPLGAASRATRPTHPITGHSVLGHLVAGYPLACTDLTQQFGVVRS